MTTVLDRIIANKRVEVDHNRHRLPWQDLKNNAARVEPPRDFFAAVSSSPPHGIHLIAEVKKASPSAGVLVDDFDPARIARIYHQHGASAVSVLTDETFFQGSLEHLDAVKQAVPLPVLRKDFIIDAYQIYESRAAGADAVLLIADVLDKSQLTELHRLADSLGMTTLVESHGVDALTMVLDTLGAPGRNRLLLGINNRDLAAQKTSLDVTRRLAPQLPKNVPFVAESGIATREDVLAMQEAGARAILVGESLLRAPAIGAQIDNLLHPRNA